MPHSDRKKFETALKKWDLLHYNDAYSVPADIGKVAIFCSYMTVAEGEVKKEHGGKEIRIFRKEAFALADRLREWGFTSEVILNAGIADFRDVLKDPTISDVFTIGHGDLSFFYADADDSSATGIDWQDISKFADHLKTGDFVQRHCGGFVRNLNVPLGTFAVADHARVVAALGLAFEPRGLDHPTNDFLESVTVEERLSYELIKENFSYSDFE